MSRRRLPVPTIDPAVCGTVVLACGSGSMGQLGHGEDGKTEDMKPRKVASIPVDVGIVEIAAGSMHSALLTVDNRIFMCGANDFGAVPIDGYGKGDEVWEFKELVFSAADLKAWGKPVRISCGASVTAMLTNKGSVVAWGYLRSSNGTMNTHPLFRALQERPTLIVSHEDHRCVQIACGDNHIVALTENGRIVTFGDGEQGQLGRCSTNRPMRSTRLADSHAVLSSAAAFDNVWAGSYWTAAVERKKNQLLTCGLNNYGQLGVALTKKDNSDDGTEEEPILLSFMAKSPAFNSLTDGQKWTGVCGDHHILAMRDDGTAYTIGRNQDHRLGTGSWFPGPPEAHWREMTLQKLTLPSPVVGVTSRSGGSAVWCEDGNGYSWGCDTCGQLGVGLGDGELVPEPKRMQSKHLEGLHIMQIAQAEQHTLVLAREK